MRRGRAGFALTAALAWLGLSAGAAHAEPRRVLVESSCAPPLLDLFELLYLLRVELPPERIQVGATRDELGSASQPDLRVVLCAEPDRLDVLSLQAGDAPPEARQLDLSGLPENARTRALALALAEIIVSTPAAAASAPPPAPTTAPTEPAETHANAPRPKPATQSPAAPTAVFETDGPRPSARIGAAFATRAVALPDALGDWTLLYGPALGVDLSRWHVGAVLLLGRADDPLGTVSIASATGALGYDLWRSEELGFAARVRGELGVTWATGEPRGVARARSAEALAAVGLFELAWLARLSGPWILDLQIAPGYARGLGALASGSRSVTTHGLVLAASAGLSWEVP